jgi:hypothetical protein
MINKNYRYIVAFSIERFAVVYFPFSRYKINKKNKSCVIMILLLISLLLYIYTLFGFFDNNNRGTGTGSEPSTDSNSNSTIGKRLSSLNILITILIPFVIIITINCLISYKLIKNRREKRLLPPPPHSAATAISAALLSRSNRGSRCDPDEIGLRNGAGERNLTDLTVLKREKSYLRTARQLLIILTAFLVLNSPLVYSTLRYLFFNYAIMDKISEQLALSALSSLQNSSSIAVVPFLNVTNSLLMTSTPPSAPVNVLAGMLGSTVAASRQSSPSASISSDWVAEFEMLIAFVAEPVYYLNFSVNFFLYAFDKRQLKKPKVLFCGCFFGKSKRRQLQHQRQSVSQVF